MLETSSLCHLFPAVLLSVTTQLNPDLLAIASNDRDLHGLLGLGITHGLHLGLPLLGKSLSHLAIKSLVVSKCASQVVLEYLLLGFCLQSLHLLMLLEFLLTHAHLCLLHFHFLYVKV